MNRLITFIAAALICTVANAQGGKFTINGSVTNAEGQRVILAYGTMEKQISDTTTVKGGQFSFTGVLDNPYHRGVIFLGEIDPYSSEMNNNVTIAIEPGTITIAAPTGNLKEATVKGGKTQDELNAYNLLKKPIEKELMEYNRQYDNAEGDALEEISRQMEPVRKKYMQLQRTFWETQSDSYLSPELFEPYMNQYSYEEIKTTFEGFSKNVQDNAPASAAIKQELAALASVQPGAVAPDFTAKDINGNDFTLSSLRGKVVILDFWASWCVPCRKSNPHMLEIYNKYHDRGLDMVYVSDDDSNPNAWKKAVEKDQLTDDGFHHVLRGFKWDRSKGINGIDRTNDISLKYAVHSLPTKYLIDKEGKIVCRIGENDNLEQLIDSLLQ